MNRPLLVIVGPTASGKTSLSLLLAQRLNAEIVSADSRQLYRLLDIGTAKPGFEDRRRVPHHFIDILDPGEEYSAGRYGQEARIVIEDILRRGKNPIMVGGSGLYVRAAVDGLFEGPEKDPELRERLEEEKRRNGIEGLLKKLEQVDPETAQWMRQEPKVRRIVRALEVFYSTGLPLSQFHKEQRRVNSFETSFVGLDWERNKLYERIDERVDQMLGRGFLEEVRHLMTNYDRSSNSLNTVGYRELMDHLDGNISLEEAVALIKRNTRRFAKRQLTWFNADKRVQWHSLKSEKDLADLAENWRSVGHSDVF